VAVIVVKTFLYTVITGGMLLLGATVIMVFPGANQ
jgi:hypothetical protein